MIRILIADDHELLRQGIRRIIEKEPDITIVSEAGDGTQALRLIREKDIDIALLDVSMPGMTGLEVLAQVRAERPDVAVVMLSMHAEEQFAVEALQSGAMAYLSKNRTSTELVAALRRVAQGRRYVTESLAERMAELIGGQRDEHPHTSLSPRELQVMIRLARGERLSHIAAELFLSPKTVSTYRARIFSKLHIGSIAELTRYALEHELVE